jgi:hypothetical protein
MDVLPREPRPPSSVRPGVVALLVLVGLAVAAVAILRVGAAIRGGDGTTRAAAITVADVMTRCSADAVVAGSSKLRGKPDTIFVL